MAQAPDADGISHPQQSQSTAETGSCPIKLDIDSWEPTVRAKIEEYQGIGSLLSQRYQVECDYDAFTFMCSMPGTK